MDGICIYTKFKSSSLNLELDFLENAREVLTNLLESTQIQIQKKLQIFGQEWASTAVERKSNIGLRYALGLKEAATIMLSDNSSEKESLKIVMAKKLKSLDNQINSLSEKLNQKKI